MVSCCITCFTFEFIDHAEFPALDANAGNLLQEAALVLCLSDRDRTRDGRSATVKFGYRLGKDSWTRYPTQRYKRLMYDG